MVSSVEPQRMVFGKDNGLRFRELDGMSASVEPQSTAVEVDDVEGSTISHFRSG